MGLFEFALLLAWAVIVFLLWVCFQLIAQIGRLLLRVEALERQLGDAVGLTLAPKPPEVAAEGYHDPVYEIPEEEASGSGIGIPPGTVLHDFELPDLDGRQHLRSQWLGQWLLIIVEPAAAELLDAATTPAPSTAHVTSVASARARRA